MSSNNQFPYWTFHHNGGLDIRYLEGDRTCTNDDKIKTKTEWLLLNHQFLIGEVREVKKLMKNALVSPGSATRSMESKPETVTHENSDPRTSGNSRLRNSNESTKADQSVYLRETQSHEHASDASLIERPFVSSLEYLSKAFSLSPFERSVLALCAGRELDSEVGTLCTAIFNGSNYEGKKESNNSFCNNNYDRNYSNNNSRSDYHDSNLHFSSYPNFALASLVFPEAHWSAISPTSPLRYYELVNLHQYPESSLVNYPLHINERILHFLIGVFYLDEKVRVISRPILESEISIKKFPFYPDSHKKIAHDLSSTLSDFPGNRRTSKGNSLSLHKSMPSNTPSVLRQMRQHEQLSYDSKKVLDLPVIVLNGKDNVGTLNICEIAFLNAQITPVNIPTNFLPSKAEDQDNLRRTLRREALLMSLGYHFLLTEDSSTDESVRNLLDLIDSEILSSCPIVVSNSLHAHRLQLMHRSKLSFEVKRPTKQEQTQLWSQFLDIGDTGSSGSGPTSTPDKDPQYLAPNHSIMVKMLIEKITNYFDLNVSEITLAAEQVKSQYEDKIITTAKDSISGKEAKTFTKNDVVPDQNKKMLNSNVMGLSSTSSTTYVGSKMEGMLWNFLKSQTRQRFTSPAAKSVSLSSINFDDLILPKREKELLENILIHMRYKTKVYDDWGFGNKKKNGLNTTALFSGASGTGKTMAAEILAGSLDLDLYEVDLSETVSKYVGETEKNLSRIFDAAEGGGCVLFFDEADSLFGKRTDVKDSHDRYANIGVAYLLKKIESSHAALTILATNMKEVIDRAFMRRIKFVVNFPLPDQESRKKIWKSVFPSTSPTRDIDFSFLSKLNITGAQIRNIAENAAFMAANENTSIRMIQIKSAAQMEYLKTGRILTGSNDENRWTQS